MNRFQLGFYFMIKARNKALFLCLLLLFVLFSACKKTSDLPRQTTGAINSISIIIEDQLWNGEIGDSLRNTFASPVIGLPEEEPLFTINQYPAKLLEGFATASRAIIVIKKESVSGFEIKKNQYASPQNVFHISGNTTAEIVRLLALHSAKIIGLIKQGEIAESQKIAKQSPRNTVSIKRQFHIEMQLPSSFKTALEKPNFVWLKKNTSSGSSSLLVYQLPLKAINKTDWVVSVLKMRDSVGKNIQGAEPQTYMISEAGYTPYFFKSKIEQQLAYKTCGTWRLQNDYMSGPFINYIVADTIHNRWLVLEGFCYSPSKEKRDVMHELDAIIQSVRLVKKPTFAPQIQSN